MAGDLRTIGVAIFLALFNVFVFFVDTDIVMAVWDVVSESGRCNALCCAHTAARLLFALFDPTVAVCRTLWSMATFAMATFAMLCEFASSSMA